MAYSKVPTDHISGYLYLTSDGAGAIAGTANSTEYVLIPRATLTQLSAADAHATTGDFRKIFFALFDFMYRAWKAPAEADRSTKMIVSAMPSIAAKDIDANGRDYMGHFDIDLNTVDVTDE